MKTELNRKDLDEWIEEQNENFVSYAVRYVSRGTHRHRIELNRNGRGVMKVWEKGVVRYIGMDRDKAIDHFNSIV